MLRDFLRLPLIMPFPAGMTPNPGANFALEGLMANANAYAEQYVSIATSGTDVALTAAQILAKNIILTAGASGAYTLTLPATARIIDSLGPCMPRDGSFYFPFYISAEAVGYTGTLTAADGDTTISGDATLATDANGKWIVRVLSSSTTQGPLRLVFQRISTCGAGGSGGSPGNPNLSVQYNKGGIFTGDADFLFDDATTTLSVGSSGIGVVKAGNSLQVISTPGSPLLKLIPGQMTAYTDATEAVLGTMTLEADTITVIGDTDVIFLDTAPTIKKTEGVYLQLKDVAGAAVAQLRILESTDVYGGSVGLGLNALALCGPDLYNVAIGPYALAVNTVGASNVAIGEGALAANDADDNTAVGEEALYANTSGIGNTAVGQAALTSNTTGGRNTALGYGAMGFNEDGDENIAIGSSALKNNVSGDHNIAIGREALQAHTASVGNTAIGYRAGVFFAGPSADYNTIMGWQAGDNFDSGSGANVDLGAHPTDTATTIGVHNNCIIIGYDLNLPNDTSDGEMTIGNLIFGTGLGAVGKTVSSGNVGIAVPAPSARLHLPAGATGAGTAPLKLTSGTNNTTAEAGAVEYNGTNLFFTRSGTTREGVLTQSAVTTEVIVSDTSVTVNIGGVTYKLLARA